jgi:hypothetical protein
MMVLGFLHKAWQGSNLLRICFMLPLRSWIGRLWEWIKVP